MYTAKSMFTGTSLSIKVINVSRSVEQLFAIIYGYTRIGAIVCNNSCVLHENVMAI
jgi:hypothetical protein